MSKLTVYILKFIIQMAVWVCQTNEIYSELYCSFVYYCIAVVFTQEFHANRIEDRIFDGRISLVNRYRRRNKGTNQYSKYMKFLVNFGSNLGSNFRSSPGVQSMFCTMPVFKNVCIQRISSLK